MRAKIDGLMHTLDDVVGEGGEALVYRVDERRVAKIYKQTTNAAKITALRSMQLPACLVHPQSLVHDCAGAPIGYVMAHVADAKPVSAFMSPAVRGNGFTTEDALALLRRLHADLHAIHRAGLVVGDLNDCNVLVGTRGPQWIDVDSYAFAGFPCVVFSERYLDPRITPPHFDIASDWYAFAALALELLLFISPYGGVVAGKTLRERIAARITVFAAGVRLPKAMQPLASLPALLRDTLEAILGGDARVFPEHALAQRLAPSPRAPTVAASGRVRVTVRPRPPLPSPYRVWMHDDTLYAAREHEIAIGQVLAHRTQLWLGATFGLALTRISSVESGTLTIGATFRPDRRGLCDNLRFPHIHGRVRALTCTFSHDHAWLFYERESAGQRISGVYMFTIAGTHVAHREGDAWIACHDGHTAAGAVLFVPTDDGIARIEALNVTAVFAETAPYVSTESHLSCQPDGIAVCDAHTFRVLSLEETP